MIVWLLSLALLGCAGGDGEGKGPEGEEKEEFQPDPRSLVEVAAVATGSVGSHLVGAATVESEAQATIVPEATGVVTELLVEEGDTVRKGQVLAVLSSPTLEGSYAQAKGELERAERDADSARRLYAQGALSRAELDVAEGTLRAAKTAFSQASDTRGFTRLTSPIAGTVAQRNLRFGELAGPQAAFTVVDLDRLRVVVSLPERDARRVRAGLPVELVSAYDAAVKATGKVLRVAPVIDAASGTFRTTVAVEPGQALRPGQFVSVRIEVDRHEDVLTVSRRALVWEEGKPYVYRVTELTPEEVAKEEEEKKKKEEEAAKEGPGGGLSFSFGGGKEEEEKPPEIPGPKRKATRVSVEVGYEDNELAEVVKGLAVGDQVVVVGNEALRDGARVRLPGDPTVATKVEEAEAPAPPSAEAG